MPGFISSLRAEDNPASPTPPPSDDNEAIVINPVADASPLIPKLVIKGEDILDSKTEDLGNQLVTVERLNPIVLPSPSEAAPPPDPLSPGVQEQCEEFIEKYRKTTKIFIGATIFRSSTLSGYPRTLVQVWDRERGITFKLWSAADWNLFGGIGEFEGPDGHKYALFMSYSETDLDLQAQIMAGRGQEYFPPVIPEIPAAPTNFVVGEGSPSADALAPIVALHDFYNSHQAELQAAYDAREQAREARLLLLRDNPPRPKNIVIRHWRMDQAGQQGTTPQPAVAR